MQMKNFILTVMEPTIKEQINYLRERLVIGIRYAQVLLEKTNGDAEKAILLYQHEMIGATMAKAGVYEEMAAKHLAKHKYDISMALKSIDEERYSLGERMMRRYADKEEALSRLADAVQVKRNYWLDVEDAATKPNAVFCLLVIKDWFDYEGWEGFDSALFHNTELVTDLISTNFQLPAIADTIRDAKFIYASQQPAQMEKLWKEGAVGPTPEFKAIEKQFLAQRPMLIDRLYEYVNDHLYQFE
jgi:hypothetical protein